MREILFRGKRIDNGEWTYGYYYADDTVGMTAILNATKRDSPYILIDGSKEVDFLLDLAEVDPATVGQWTGKTDKNGKKIFEGDILQFNFFNIAKEYSQYEVLFDTENACFFGKGHIPQNTTPIAVRRKSSCEVIGTIHDKEG